MFRPPRENRSCSIWVKGHGPAMHETRTFRNCFCCSPASSEKERTVAFHLPSGEQGGRPAHGTFPPLTTSKVRTAAPIVVVPVPRVAYRTRILVIEVVLPSAASLGT